MKKINWLRMGITSFVVLFLLFAGGMLLGNWSYHGWGMLGPGRMMADWTYTPLGWMRLIATWLIPIGLLGMASFGIFWLIQDAMKPKPILY